MNFKNPKSDIIKDKKLERLGFEPREREIMTSEDVT